jgi:hypothetical protein
MEIVSLNARSSEEYFGGIGKVNRQGLFSIGDLNLERYPSALNRFWILESAEI